MPTSGRQAPTLHTLPNQDVEAHDHQWELAPLELLEPLLVGWGHWEEPVASLEHVSGLSRAVKAGPQPMWGREASGEAPSAALP